MDRTPALIRENRNSPQPASANAEVATIPEQHLAKYLVVLQLGQRAQRRQRRAHIAPVRYRVRVTPGRGVCAGHTWGTQRAPSAATTQLATSLAQAQAHASHVWRDTAPTNTDGTVNAYIEIARGDRNKWEFRMDANARAVNRVMPATLGGYPVNYGFVPQTVSYDGDPFDALVLGPALPGGRLVRGVIVGLMEMEDERDWIRKWSCR